MVAPLAQVAGATAPTLASGALSTRVQSSGIDLFKPSHRNVPPGCDLSVNTKAYLIIRSEIEADKAQRSHSRTDNTTAA
jgi:hypothetical protein